MQLFKITTVFLVICSIRLSGSFPTQSSPEQDNEIVEKVENTEGGEGVKDGEKVQAGDEGNVIAGVLPQTTKSTMTEGIAAVDGNNNTPDDASIVTTKPDIQGTTDNSAEKNVQTPKATASPTSPSGSSHADLLIESTEKFDRETTEKVVQTSSIPTPTSQTIPETTATVKTTSALPLLMDVSTEITQEEFVPNNPTTKTISTSSPILYDNATSNNEPLIAAIVEIPLEINNQENVTATQAPSQHTTIAGDISSAATTTVTDISTSSNETAAVVINSKDTTETLNQETTEKFVQTSPMTTSQTIPEATVAVTTIATLPLSLNVSTEPLSNSTEQEILVSNTSMTETISTRSPILHDNTTPDNVSLIALDKADQESLTTATVPPQYTPTDNTSSTNDTISDLNVAIETATNKTGPTETTMESPVSVSIPTNSTDNETTTATNIIVKKPLLQSGRSHPEEDSSSDSVPTSVDNTTRVPSPPTSSDIETNDTDIILSPVADPEVEILDTKRGNAEDDPIKTGSSESDDPETVKVDVVNITLAAPANSSVEKVPYLLDLEKDHKEHGGDGSGDGDSDEGDHDHHSDGKGHDHHHPHDDDKHTGAAHHEDSPEDRENKKRTAIIVGVAVGGVALFTLAYFTSRHCRKNSRDNEKKSPENRETIEFMPLNTSHPAIYDDMEARNPNGLYRHGPKMGPPSPRMHRKNEGKFEFPEVRKSSGPTLEVPNRSQPSGSSHSLSDEPFLSKHVDKIKYMDESTDDELDDTPRQRLLPSNGQSPEDTPQTSPAEPEVRIEIKTPNPNGIGNHDGAMA